MSSETPFKLRVQLWVYPGQEAAFDAFEAHAMGVMQEHGLRLLSRNRLGALYPDGPFETHVIHCPNARALKAYQADPRLQAKSDLRAQTIARTDATRHPAQASQN